MARGTHTGTFRGIPPTGKHAMTTWISITRVASRNFVEGRIIFDELGLLKQLGIVPSPRQVNECISAHLIVALL